MNTYGTGRRASAAISAAILLAGLLVSAAAVPAAGVDPTPTTLPRMGAPEAEPNDDARSATPLVGNPSKHTGNLHPKADDDWYSFSAAAGSRVYATVNTTPNLFFNDLTMSIVGRNGWTVVEKDFDDGSFAPTAPVIAGTRLPTTGTYYLRIVGGAGALPYDLFVDVRSGSPTPEVEPNNAVAPQVVGSSALIAGARSDATDVDAFSVSLDVADTVVAILDLDPERDGTEWNGQLGIGPFAGARIDSDDPGTEDIDAEALFVTIRDAGAYQVVVTANGTQTGTYTLDVIRFPRSTTSCRQYENTTPFAVPDLGSETSTIDVPDSFTVGRVAVMLDASHARLGDLNASLTTPNGNVTKVIDPSNHVGMPTAARFVVDDHAALPPDWTTVPSYGQFLRPPLPARLRWLEGGPANGTWTLRVYDASSGGSPSPNTGTVNSWAVVVCERPVPALPPSVVFSTNFEAGGAGFTHHGAKDEWELGAPSMTPIVSCASGTTCWKTDLDERYEVNSAQVLVSPPIDLTHVAAPATVSFAHRYNMEPAVTDSYDVEARIVNRSDYSLPVFVNTEGFMFAGVGPPFITLATAVGWETVSVDVSPLVGHVVEFRWRVTTDSGNIATGVAVDDVVVRAHPGLACTRLTLRLAEDGTKSKPPSCVGGTAPYSAAIGTPPSHGTARAATRVTYKPQANFNGADSFSAVVTDAAGLTDGMPVRVRVAPVNDAPQFRGGGDQAIVGAAGDQKVAPWATRIRPGPANEAAQRVRFVAGIVSRTGGLTFAKAPKVSGAGDLTYTVARGSFGSATIAVRAVDDGPSAAPNVNRSKPQTFTITASRGLLAAATASEVTP